MLELSIKEQKQINGGVSYIVTSYTVPGNSVIDQEEFDNYHDASYYKKYMVSMGYRVVISKDQG